MSVEENLRVIEAATKALNARDLDTFESLHLNSVLQKDPQNPQGIKGPKAIRASLNPFLKAFPDIRLVTETQFGAGDWVTQLGHMRGTNTGPLEMPGGQTIPATNKAARGRQVCGGQPLFRSGGPDGPAWPVAPATAA